MKTVAQLRVTDLDATHSQSEAVEAARSVLHGKGLEIKMHQMATDVEGDIDEVLDAVKVIHTQLHAAGHSRLATTLTVETRQD